MPRKVTRLPAGFLSHSLAALQSLSLASRQPAWT